VLVAGKRHEWGNAPAETGVSQLPMPSLPANAAALQRL
jgi:hypothetical protein